MVESLSVLSLCMFKTVRLRNRSWFILERSHVFSLRAVEKVLSPAALVAGFTRVGLHNVITSFIISRSGLGSSLSMLWTGGSVDQRCMYVTPIRLDVLQTPIKFPVVKVNGM